MITLEELNNVKEKRKTSLYYEEKEYFQYIFLNAISKYHEYLTFKGGTCLRICYGLGRASEDLDFSTTLSVKKIKEIFYKCMKEFDYLNIKYNIYPEKEFKGNIRFEVKFEGPLFTGKQQSTNTLKIDFNHGKTKNKLAKVINKLFSDIPIFIIIAMDEKEILAEKIRTLINRKEPRDLYDLWMLLSKGTEIDKKLIYEKLKEEKSDLSKLDIPSEKEYKTSLKNLVYFLPDYNQVKKEVLEKLRKLQDK